MSSVTPVRAPRHRRRRGRALLLGVAAALVVSAAMATAAPSNGQRGGRGGGGPGTFDISGSVDGLVPTVGSVVPLLLENQDRRAVDVVSLEVVVGTPVGDCAAEELELVLPQLPITVPGGSEVVVDVAARLAPGVADGCQGAVWPLTWTGTAERTP